ncbi:MAG: hypothetical protein FD167_495 [bacterium]|nr:MAG: hypothetical protein FD167_495 [bacterium]
MKLKKLIGYFSPSLRETQKCEACGQGFICGASVMGCWCSKIKLSQTTLTDLRSRYKHCLCQSCLEKLAITNPT